MSAPFLLSLLVSKLEIQPTDHKTIRRKNLEEMVQSIIQCCSVINFRCLTNKEMEDAGGAIISALKFLCREDTTALMKILSEILYVKQRIGFARTEYPDDNSKLMSIRDPLCFVRAVIAGMHNLVWDKENFANVEDYQNFVQNLLFTSLELIHTDQPFSGLVVKTLINIIENHGVNLSYYRQKSLFFHVMEKLSSTRIPVKSYINKLYQRVTNFISIDTREEYLKATLFSECYCDTSSYAKIEVLMNALPAPTVKQYVTRICCWVIVGITRENTAQFSRKILKIILPNLTFAEYVLYINNVMDCPELLGFTDDQKSLFHKNKIRHIFTLALQQFGKSFSDIYFQRATKLDICELLYASLEAHFINSIEPYSKELKQYIMDSEDIVKVNSFRILCYFPKKSCRVTEWHLKLFISFLRDIDVSWTDKIKEDVKIFFSHIFYSFKKEKSETLLCAYKKFISCMQEFVVNKLTEELEYEKGLMVSEALISVFVKKQLAVRYLLTEKDLNWVISATSPVNFELVVTTKELVDGILINYLNIDSNCDLFLDFFYHCYFCLLTSEEHEAAFSWAYNFLRSCVNIERTERLRKYIIQHLVYLREKELSYEMYVYRIFADVSKSLDPDDRRPKFLIFKLLSTLYSQGFLKTYKNKYLVQLAKTLILQLDIMISRIFCPNMEGSIMLKIAEHAAIHGFELIGLITMDLKDLELIKVCISFSNKIISRTNMRKAVTESSIQLRKICINILHPDEEPEKKVIIFSLLEHLLESILIVGDNGCSKIRRSAEFRFIIHAISTADRLLNQPILNRSMAFLVEAISDKSTSDSSLITVFNCIEALIGDRSVMYSTHKYLEVIIIQSINLFPKPNWKLKNSTLHALTISFSRILGQQNTGARSTKIENVFCVFPEVTYFLFNKLVDFIRDNRSFDSTVVCLALFSESYSSDSILLSSYLKDVDFIFLKIFVNLVLNDEYCGHLASSAVTAFCRTRRIPAYICEISHFLKSNFHFLKKNILRNIMYLLKSLCLKFRTFDSQILASSEEKNLICKSLHDIFNCFNSKRGNFQLLCSLLHLNILTVDECKEMDVNSGYLEYSERLCMYNNIRYLMKNVPVSSLNMFLKRILMKNVGVCFQITCLSCLADRLRNIDEDDFKTLLPICDTLLYSFITNQSSCQYLLSVYSNILIYLVQRLRNTSIAASMIAIVCNSYQAARTDNLYIISVFAAVLSKSSDHLDCDKTFVSLIIGTLKKRFVLEDDDVDFFIASMLTYVFKCADKTGKYELLKIAFLLLFKDTVCNEICKFISSIFNISKSSVNTSLHSLLHPFNLKLHLGDYLAATFLAELLIFLSSVNRNMAKSEDYFCFQRVSTIYCCRKSLKKIVLRNFLNLYTVLDRKEYLRLFSHCDFSF